MWSVIDYGSIVYNSAPDTAKNRLDVIQHKALHIACGAFCSTAASAMQVDTEELPLALRRSQQEIKYSVKVKSTNGHPAKSVADFHWTTRSKKFKVSTAPIYCKTLQYFWETNNQLTTQPTLPELPPWHLNPCNVDASLIDCCSEHQNPVLLKNLALARIESYSSSVHVYTDASKTSDNRTSAPFYILWLNVQHGS